MEKEQIKNYLIDCKGYSLSETEDYDMDARDTIACMAYNGIITDEEADRRLSI